MLDVTKLSDDELAVLTYAIEPFHDDTRGGVYKANTEKTAEHLRLLLSSEYNRRGLHWSTYQND